MVYIIFLGVALRDSPVGLVAYILETFIKSTDPTFHKIERKFNIDKSVFWVFEFWKNKITSFRM